MAMVVQSGSVFAGHRMFPFWSTVGTPSAMGAPKESTMQLHGQISVCFMPK
jgi:hypothetical protein